MGEREYERKEEVVRVLTKLKIYKQTNKQTSNPYGN